MIDQTTSKILRDYGQVLEAINEQRNGYVRGLHPDSRLPYPKEVIHAAFTIAFKQMERYGWQQWNGVPKNVLEMAATSLDIHFAPDQEVPDDPLENFAAFNKRQLEQSPEIHAKVFASLKANPEGWNRLLEIAGISKDSRDVIVKLVREKRV